MRRFAEEYYTQRKRCQLTRCRVDQHSSKVRSLIAAALFDRDNCFFFLIFFDFRVGKIGKKEK